MQLERLAEEFLNYIVTERRFSPQTVQAYSHDLRTFQRFLNSRGIAPTLECLTPEVLRAYLSWLDGRDLKSTTIRRRFHGLRSLWRYACDWHGRSGNPFRQVQLPQPAVGARSVLSPEEVRHLLDATEETRYVARGIRDRAVLTLLVSTGLRRQEVLDLTLHDIDLVDGLVRVRRGKGNRSRVVPLVPEAKSALEDWLEFRESCQHTMLFINHMKQPLGIHGLHGLFRRALRRTGIKRSGITLHTLRHTFATLALRSGCDLRSLQSVLGHASLETTALYLHTDLGSLRRAVSGFSISPADADG